MGELIRIEPLEANDPTFEAGSAHTATALMTNPTLADFTYSVELYLGIMKVASSGVGAIAIPAGQSQSVLFTITMPAVEGDYPVFIDVLVEGVLIAHYQATENVVIEVVPAIIVDDPVWGEYV